MVVQGLTLNFTQIEKCTRPGGKNPSPGLGQCWQDHSPEAARV